MSFSLVFSSLKCMKIEDKSFQIANAFEKISFSSEKITKNARKKKIKIWKTAIFAACGFVNISGFFLHLLNQFSEKNLAFTML